jgi:arsenate reductase-like glutaredoxin family protein
VQINEQVDARQAKLTKADAIRLAGAAGRVICAKGKVVVHLDMKKNPPSRADLLKHMLGPTGNLRAPTIRIGKTVLVGFDEETYRSALT